MIEVGSQAGWVKDLCEALGVEVQVANPNHEGRKRGGVHFTVWWTAGFAPGPAWVSTSSPMT